MSLQKTKKNINLDELNDLVIVEEVTPRSQILNPYIFYSRSMRYFLPIIMPIAVAIALGFVFLGANNPKGFSTSKNNIGWIGPLYIFIGIGLVLFVFTLGYAFLRNLLILDKNLSMRQNQDNLILLKVREMNSRIAEIEKILNENKSKSIDDRKELGVDVFDSVVTSVLKNTKKEYLGRYIVVDPVTKKYEMGNDCLEIEEQLTKRLKDEGLLSENPKFYMKFIDEDDIEKVRAA